MARLLTDDCTDVDDSVGVDDGVDNIGGIVCVVIDIMDTVDVAAVVTGTVVLSEIVLRVVVGVGGGDVVDDVIELVRSWTRRLV